MLAASALQQNAGAEAEVQPLTGNGDPYLSVEFVAILCVFHYGML